ncbi:MAG: SAM-dependent methyltransferase [Gammaproteobacteria bacterium]|nr:SAM-dependent methyltransferase [Gammaproteobacteria bacterium]
MEVTTRLPDPSPEQVALSRILGTRIDAEIARGGGFLPFDRFMDLALYAPGLGYYVAHADQFGANGDFVTAPEISPLYGAALAAQCALTLEALAEGMIIEFGGGSGRMALAILKELRRRGVWPVDYAIVELSPALRELQRETLSAADPAIAACVRWWQTQPESPTVGVVIANEVIDALPVSVFECADNELYECGVGKASCGFEWLLRAAPSGLAQEIALRVGPAPQSRYRSELNLRQAVWLADLKRFLSRGVAIIADYGYPRHEYYHPDRSEGTLQCHYRQRVHSNVFWYPGLQDITASVDFSALAEAATTLDFEVRGYADQASYLLSSGITERLAELATADALVQYRAAQAVKTLLLPQAMGTRVKFMSLSRDYSGPISGYLVRDDRHRL